MRPIKFVTVAVEICRTKAKNQPLATSRKRIYCGAVPLTIIPSGISSPDDVGSFTLKIQ
jgi:hypothetical protein